MSGEKSAKTIMFIVEIIIMNNSDETTEIDNKVIFKAINDSSKRLKKLEKTVFTKFESIREGITCNSAKFDRRDIKIYDVRSDISNLRADIKEMSERQRTIETLELNNQGKTFSDLQLKIL
ncbi:MAG: hypothetical protein ACR2F2_11675 [Pyrinomonadaceae bacterium]